jgi:outer membrane protein insertion porin family
LSKYLFGVIASLMTLCGIASAQVFDGQTIGAVNVSGLERVSEQVVRAKLEVQPGQPYNGKAVARDIRRLYDLGYFSHIEADVTDTPAGVDLTYVVAEKRFISEIKIAGNDKLKTRKILGALSLREGDALLEDSLAAEREAVLDLYESKGFANTTVDITSEVVGPNRVRLLYSIQEGRKARINTITFEGNEALSDGHLRKTMATKKSWWFLGGKYEEDKFEADLQKVVDEYGDHGRLEAAIESLDMVYAPDGKHMDITIYVSEGPQYTVGTLDFAENVVYDPEELTELVKTAPGEVHNKSQVAKDAAKLTNLHQSSGYVNADVTPQVTLDKENHTTTVVHRVDEGDLKYIRQVDITGNEITKDEVIRRQIVMVPGERYDGEAREYSQASLERLDYFEKVRLTLRDVEGSSVYTDLLADVDEGRTGNFLFGGGFSTDEGLGGYGELKLRNFDISNWKTFSGAGQQLRIRANVGSQRDTYLLSFTDPEFAGYPFSFGFDVYDTSYKYRGGADYREDNRGVVLRLGKALSDRLYITWLLRYDQTEVSDLPWLTRFDRSVPLQEKEETIFRTGIQLQYDSTDRPYDTTRGTKQSLSLELAGLADYDFFKATMDSEWWFALDDDKRWVLSFRTREGYVSEYGDSDYVPLQDRMYAGGTGSVRGYETRDIGPRSRDWIFAQDFAVGGNVNWITNTELKWAVTDMFRLYAFVDSGGVWSNEFHYGDEEIQFSAGLGAGARIPRFGPIRVDYGFAINPRDDQPSGRLHLSTGFSF